MKRLEGIVVPMVTPLTEDFTLDVPALERLVEHLIKGGVSGLFPAGTTGGGPMLPVAMQKQLCRETVRIANGRCKVLMGVSSASPEDTLAMAHYAADNGADMIVSAAPCYLPLTPDCVFGYYEMLSSRQPLPVFIYNMPSMTKINMLPKLVCRVATLPKMAGYKDSSGDMGAMHDVLEVLKERDDFSVMMGPEVLLSAAVIFGAAGGVSAGANLYPEFFVNCWKAAKSGNLDEMQKWQRKIEIWDHAYSCYPLIAWGVTAALKIGLSRKGICDTHLLPPMTPVTREMENQVAAIMERLG